MKYIDIRGGDRYESPLLGYKATFCLKHLEEERRRITQPSPPSVAPMFFRKYERVSYSLRPEYGIGQLLADSDDKKAMVYFTNVGCRSVNLIHQDIPTNYLVRTDYTSSQPLLDLLHSYENLHNTFRDNDETYNVYIMELDPSVKENTKFQLANYGCDASKPCVYVGMPWFKSRDRFGRKRNAIHPAYFPRKYGVRLLEDLYEIFNPMSRELASLMEKKLADALKGQGFSVWQD